MTADQIVADLQALQKATESPDGYLTTKQIAIDMDMSVKTVRILLHAAAKEGRLDKRAIREESPLTGALIKKWAFRVLP